MGGLDGDSGDLSLSWSPVFSTCRLREHRPFEAQGKQECRCYSLHDVARAEVARIERLAPGKTFILAVIEADAVFAKPPAKVYLFIVDARWKIEEADVQILDYASGFEDAIQRRFHCFRKLSVLRAQGSQFFIRHDNAADHGDPRGHGGEISLETRKLLAAVHSLKQ